MATLFDGPQMFGCTGKAVRTGAHSFAFVVELEQGAKMMMTKAGHMDVPKVDDKFVDLCFMNGAGDWLCSFTGIPSSMAQNLVVGFLEGGC